MFIDPSQVGGLKQQGSQQSNLIFRFKHFTWKEGYEKLFHFLFLVSGHFSHFSVISRSCFAAHKWTTSKVLVLASLLFERAKRFFFFISVQHSFDILKDSFCWLIYLSEVALFSVPSICSACPWYLPKEFKPPYASVFDLEDYEKKKEKKREKQKCSVSL